MRKITEIVVTHKRGRPNYGSQGAEVRCTVENPDDSLDIGETIMSVTKLIEDAWERKVNPPKEVKGAPEVKVEVKLQQSGNEVPAAPKKRGRPAKVVPAAEGSEEVAAVIKPESETASDKRAAKISEDESAAFFDEDPEGDKEEPAPNGEPVQDAFNWDE